MNDKARINVFFIMLLFRSINSNYYNLMQQVGKFVKYILKFATTFTAFFFTGTTEFLPFSAFIAFNIC